MKLRSSRVYKRGIPKFNSSFNERRLSLRSNKSNYAEKGVSEAETETGLLCADNWCENLEMGMEETVNTDDKGLFLGSEVLDPIKDLVFSFPKEEVVEEEGSESTSVHFEELVKSPHVDCESGAKIVESETLDDDTMIVNGDDDDGKETFLNDSGDSNLLGEGKEMRKQKKLRNLKNIESMLMPLRDKRGRKRKNAEASGSKCDGITKKEKVQKHRVRVTRKVFRSRKLITANGGPVALVDGGYREVVQGLKSLDEGPNQSVKHCEIPPKVLTEGENTRPKKKSKKLGKPCKPQGEIAPLPSNEIPMKKLERPGRPRKVLTEGENTSPKKKLKKRGRPFKLQGETATLPLNEIPRKKQERRGRPRKVSDEIPEGPMKSCGIKPKLYSKGNIFKKFKRRGRPPKTEARTLATHVIKMRTVKTVKKSTKGSKNVNLEENSEQMMVEGEFLNARKGIIGRKLERRQLKLLIRDKIADVLLKCGWAVDLRQRQEKIYKDTVYIEPNGKSSHWSITGAYAKLKRKIENGKADNTEMSEFTPIPEEEISILFRQRRKELKKDKNKVLKSVKKSKSITFKKKKHGKKSKDESTRKMLFKPRISENGSKQDNQGVLVIKKLNLLSWMIDSGVILAGTKVHYGKTRRQKRSSEGIINSDGISCCCCNEIMGITEFVGHCGGKCAQVFDNLYLESGTSLRKCLMDSWRKEEESNISRFNVVDVQGDDPNDDTCNICGDGGNLICCDSCPSTFHQSCLDVQNFPSGDWNCIYCTCKFCGVVSVSTPHVEDPHDAITSHMLSCCLCDEKFHQLCLQEVKDVNEDSNRLPFCGTKCRELFERLQTYLGVKNELEDGFSWTLLQRSDLDQDLSVHDAQLKVEHNSKLAIAFSVMDECFVPIVDDRSGVSIIRNVVYNCRSNFKRLNYGGFLTAVLEKGDEFITAASIRIHGYRLAEMPFIGTRHMYRRQGMCRRLLDAIESTLSSIGVEELIIPAIPALLQTWTDAFGFMPLEESKKQTMKSMSIMMFPGIDMLKKPLLQNQSADVDHTLCAVAAGASKDVTAHEQKEEMVLITDGCSSPKPNNENDTQFETTSSNATDCKQTSADTAGVGKDVTDCEQMEKETVLMDCCSCPDLENDKLTVSHGVNSLCDLNLPVKNITPCDNDGQTSVDFESFPYGTIEPRTLESMVCENLESSEMKLDVENDIVPGVKLEPSPLTSIVVPKNMFDLNLHPTALETDVHIDESVQCESRACIKPFDLSDSRSQADQIAEGQTDS